MKFLHYPVADIGTAATIVAAFLVIALGNRIIDRSSRDAKVRYIRRQVLQTVTLVVGIVVIAILWARLLEHAGTFLGLVGAGLAVAFREPLLAIAGRIAILAGHIYNVGDRIEFNKIRGDVIDVGFFYTRMMEIGNWISGDQASGRMVQFSNSKLFGGDPVFNYTQNFSYIWDEVKLPITYASNIEETSRALLEVGGEYSHEFLQGAQQQLEQMQRTFLVPNFELKPQVYMSVNSNWVELSMRYLVEPKKRRQATNFIYSHVFERLQGREDVTIASESSVITVHMGKDQGSSSQDAEKNRSEVDPQKAREDKAA